MAELCTGKIQTYPDSPIRTCRRPAVGTYTAACVHEHVITGPLCADCRDGRSKHGMLCWECHKIDGHDCPVSDRLVAA